MIFPECNYYKYHKEIVCILSLNLTTVLKNTYIIGFLGSFRPLTLTDLPKTKDY